MKLKKIFFFLVVGFLNSSCSYSKEISLIDKVNLKAENVALCNIEKININFCSDEKIKIYNQKLGSTSNFSNDKILIVLNEARYNGKGEKRNVKALVVLDSSQHKVYPLQQIVGNFVGSNLEVLINENPKIKFSEKNNKVCLSGTTFASDNNNVNVENECYSFEKNKFTQVNEKPEKPEKTNNILNSYNSDIHLKCIEKKTEECFNLNLIDTKELLRKYEFINPSDGPSIVLDKRDFQLIISPFEDESGMNLRVIQVKNNKLVDEKYIYLNKRLEIDINSVMTYYQNSKKIFYQYK